MVHKTFSIHERSWSCLLRQNVALKVFYVTKLEYQHELFWIFVQVKNVLGFSIRKRKIVSNISQ